MSTPSAIILAAGKGTRMNSDLPKVAHEVAGQAMVRWVVEACRGAGCRKIVVVVGYAQEVVRKALSGLEVEFAVQNEQHGTGHAVRCAESLFQNAGAVQPGDAFVLAGDGPLIRDITLKTLLERHRATKSAATLATSVIDDPAGYGYAHGDPVG